MESREPTSDPGTLVQAELASRDPLREVVLQAAREFFRTNEYDQFRQWLTGTYDSWDSSPSAVQLMGLSYFEQRDYARARELVERSASIWMDMGEVGALRKSTLAVVLSYIACCRAKLECAEVGPQAAASLLWTRIDELLEATRSGELEPTVLLAVSRRVWQELLALAAGGPAQAFDELVLRLSHIAPAWRDDAELRTMVETRALRRSNVARPRIQRQPQARAQRARTAGAGASDEETEIRNWAGMH